MAELDKEKLKELRDRLEWARAGEAYEGEFQYKVLELFQGILDVLDPPCEHDWKWETTCCKACTKCGKVVEE